METVAKVRQARRDEQTANDEALFRAAFTGDAPETSHLLKKRAKPDAFRDEAGNTALIASVSRGHEACAEHLLRAGADVNAANAEGATALHMATAHNHEGCVRVLLKHGADLRLTNQEGNTALSMATHDTVRELVESHVAGGRTAVTLVLLKLGLEQYASAFYDDELRSLADCAHLTDADLEVIGVGDAQHRHMILGQLCGLALRTEMAAVLKKLKLLDLAPLFWNARKFAWKECAAMSASELKDIGVSSHRARTRILRFFENAHGQENSAGAALAAASNGDRQSLFGRLRGAFGHGGTGPRASKHRSGVPVARSVDAKGLAVGVGVAIVNDTAAAASDDDN